MLKRKVGGQTSRLHPPFMWCISPIPGSTNRKSSRDIVAQNIAIHFKSSRMLPCSQIRRLPPTLESRKRLFLFSTTGIFGSSDPVLFFCGAHPQTQSSVVSRHQRISERGNVRTTCLAWAAKAASLPSSHPSNLHECCVCDRRRGHTPSI